MHDPNGIVVYGLFKESRTYDNVDETTGKKSISASYRVVVRFSDEEMSRITIYLPRNTRPPELEPERIYGFPVLVQPTRDGKRVSYTAREDADPFIPEATL